MIGANLLKTLDKELEILRISNEPLERGLGNLRTRNKIIGKREENLKIKENERN